MDAKDIARFNSKYVRGTDDECWEWGATKLPSGYGTISIGGRTGSKVLAHRLALYITTGIWGEVARHSCNNPSCVNHNHLSWGTHANNVNDKVLANRQQKGEGVPQSKLTEQQVLDIRRIYTDGNTTIYKIAKDYNVYYNTISYIITRKTWKHI